MAGRRYTFDTGDRGSSGRFSRRRLLKTGLLGLTGLGFGATTTAAGAGDEKLPNKIRVVLASDEKAVYRIEVSGRIAFGDNAGEYENDTRITESVVKGRIVGRPGEAFDEFRYSGQITKFEILRGDVTLFVNGLKGDARRGTELLDQIVVVTLTEESEYRIQTSDRIEFGFDAGENDELVDENTVEGRIVGRPGRALDAYRFAGDTVDIEVTQGAIAFRVPRAQVGKSDSEDTLPNSVLITATGDLVEYQFTVSGTVRKGPLAEDADVGPTADRVIDNNSVEGFARSDVETGDPQSDDYRYSGNILFKRAEAPVEITLEPNPDS